MKYFFLQTKRVCRAFPAILITTLILTGALALLCYLQTASDSESEEHQKISLGLVGDAEDPYLGFGVSLLQEMDSSRFTCTLTEMSEEEAQRALEKQQIHGYLIIPDDFLESVMNGENSKVTFVTGISQNGIGTLLARELADAVSTLLTETQSGIYAFQRFSEQHGAVENLTSDIYDINMRYFQYVLPRAELYDIDTPDSSPVISMQGYYFCALLLLFFLFLGTSGCHLFIRSDLSLNRILAVHGLGPVRQVLAEYSSCCILLLLSYLVIGAFLPFILSWTGVSVPELSGTGAAGYVRLLYSLVPLVPVTGALLYFLSQCAENLVSGVLLTFLCAIGLGYISGCFYPLSFFPERMQRIASVLPTGGLMEYMQNVLLGSSSGFLYLLLSGWTLLFLILACLIRKLKLSR